jgi:parallel beta-helix repeat protein
VLRIQAGTYAEQMSDDLSFPWRNGTSGNYTRYARYQNDVVTVRPSSGTFVVMFSTSRQYIELDGLILDAVNTDNSVVRDEGSHIRIKNSEIKNAPTALWPDNHNGILGAGNTYSEYLNNNIHNNDYGIYHDGSNAIIDGNLIHDNTGYGIHNYNGHGSGLSNNNIIRNNKIYSNGFSDPVHPGPGMLVGSGDGSLAYNNLIYNNKFYGIQVGYQGANNTKIYNNTVYGNGDACTLLQSSASNTTLRNNICYGNGRNVIDTSTGPTGTIQDHNLFSNPLFVNATNGDFHLQVGSPAIDGGLTISTVTKDYSGTPRPQRAAYDIGAYESIEGLPQPTNFRIVSK